MRRTTNMPRTGTEKVMVLRSGMPESATFACTGLEVGQLPMCVTTCIGRATYFGDSNDPNSLAVELTTKNNVQTLLTHLENKPQCYYIV